MMPGDRETRKQEETAISDRARCGDKPHPAGETRQKSVDTGGTGQIRRSTLSPSRQAMRALLPHPAGGIEKTCARRRKDSGTPDGDVGRRD